MLEKFKGLTDVGSVTFFIQRNVILNSLNISSFELSFSLSQELTHFSVRHLRTFVDHDVTEGEENEYHVILGHLDLMLLYSIEIRWHNPKREQNQEQVVEHDRACYPEDHPESVLERTDQHFNIDHDHYSIKDVITFEY
jgi:hypothetical protein